MAGIQRVLRDEPMHSQSDWHTCTLSIRDTNSVFIFLKKIETEKERNFYIPVLKIMYKKCNTRICTCS